MLCVTGPVLGAVCDGAGAVCCVLPVLPPALGAVCDGGGAREAGDTLLDTVLRLHDGFSSDSVLDTSSGE